MIVSFPHFSSSLKSSSHILPGTSSSSSFDDLPPALDSRRYSSLSPTAGHSLLLLLLLPILLVVSFFHRFSRREGETSVTRAKSTCVIARREKTSDGCCHRLCNPCHPIDQIQVSFFGLPFHVTFFLLSPGRRRQHLLLHLLLLLRRLDDDMLSVSVTRTKAASLLHPVSASCLTHTAAGEEEGEGIGR